MTSRGDCPDGRIYFTVRIIKDPKSKSRKNPKYIWYYNHIHSKSFSIGATSGIGHMTFELDEETSKKFKFEYPTITYYTNSQGEDYTDLMPPPDVTTTTITIYNTQQNRNFTAVGEVLFNAIPIDMLGNAIGDMISSDPEVINTGGIV
ncbi:MAG: hypothetical protein PW843_04195 [Azospirillaceae bacterium]|nr:hypothetical protein [Azospirillaceae bacterium]